MDRPPMIEAGIVGVLLVCVLLVHVRGRRRLNEVETRQWGMFMEARDLQVEVQRLRADVDAAMSVGYRDPARKVRVDVADDEHVEVLPAPGPGIRADR
jgi:hypothetical protein